MDDCQPVEIRGYFRAYSHLPIWEVMDKAGIWKSVGIKMCGMEYCASPPEAEGALFDGKIDFISGNHITPYALMGQGKPIVCLASPSNAVRDRLVLRGQKLSSLDGNCRTVTVGISGCVLHQPPVWQSRIRSTAASL